MTTLRLWLKLRNPPQDHPLFRRLLIIHQENIPWFIWLIALIVIPFVLILAIMFTATAYSLYWTFSVSTVIQGIRERNQYDLLATTPQGDIGITWLACLGAIHRNSSFGRIDGYGLWFTRLGIGFFLVNSILNSGADGFTATNSEIVIYLVLGVALIIDHYTAVVMGCLIAMLIPTISQDRFSSGFLAPGVLLILQIASYLLLSLVALVLHPEIDLQDSDSIYQVIQVAVLYLGIFALIRESIVWVCWRSLVGSFGIRIRDAWAVLDW